MSVRYFRSTPDVHSLQLDTCIYAFSNLIKLDFLLSHLHQGKSIPHIDRIYYSILKQVCQNHIKEDDRGKALIEESHHLCFQCSQFLILE